MGTTATTKLLLSLGHRIIAARWDAIGYSVVISSFLKSRPACSKVSTARYAASLSPITSDAAAVVGAPRLPLRMWHIFPSHPSPRASKWAQNTPLDTRVLFVNEG